MQSFALDTAASWKTEIQPQIVADPEQQASARQLLVQARSHHMRGFHDFFAQAAQSAYEALPPYAKLILVFDDFRADYLLHEYYEKLNEYLASAKAVAPDASSSLFVFQPLVKIDVLPSDTLRTTVAEIITHVRPEHVPRIDARLSELYGQEIATRMPCASKELQTTTNGSRGWRSIILLS